MAKYTRSVLISLVVITAARFCGCSIFTGDTAERPEKSDVVVLLDLRHSVGRGGLSHAFKFLEQFIKASSVSTETKRVGLISFGSSSRVHGNLSTSYNREHLLKIVQGLRAQTPMRGSFSIALKTALSMLTSQGRQKVPKALVLISSGVFPSEIISRSVIHHLLRIKANRFVVAVGWKINPALLTGFASLPIHKHVVRIKPDANIGKLIKTLPNVNENYTKCSQPRLDECSRRCDCINGELRNCIRVRKEFTQLSSRERIRYLINYKWLSTLEQFKSEYVPFVAMHRILFMSLIHHQDHFLTWHRHYVYAFENMIRQLDCRLTIPYWDWTYWSPVAFQMDKHIWRNGLDWMGGNGNHANDLCVETGPFADGLWKLPLYENFNLERDSTFSPQTNHGFHKSCLRRSFNGNPANRTNLATVLSTKSTDFKVFDHYLRFGYHAELHCMVGGTMCTFWASDCPEFFFHHSFLDKVWYMWQSKGTPYRDAFFKGLRNATMERTPYYQDDMYDSDALPMSIRVSYTEFPAEERDGHLPLVPKKGFSVPGEEVSDETLNIEAELAKVDLTDDMFKDDPITKTNQAARAAAKELLGITDEENELTMKLRRVFGQS